MRTPTPLRHARAVVVAGLVLVAACSSPADDDTSSPPDDGAAAPSALDTTTGSDGAAAAAAPMAADESGPASDDTGDAAKALVTATSLPPLPTTTTTTTSDPSAMPLDALAVGDCVDLPGLGTPDSVAVETARRHDCDRPHAAEVYATASLNDDPSAPYPGDDVVIDVADERCLAAFAPYVGVEYVDSSLEIVHLRPDEAVWLRGDRTIRCAVHARDLEPLVGTVEGSRR